MRPMKPARAWLIDVDDVATEDIEAIQIDVLETTASLADDCIAEKGLTVAETIAKRIRALKPKGALHAP